NRPGRRFFPKGTLRFCVISGCLPPLACMAAQSSENARAEREENNMVRLSEGPTGGSPHVHCPPVRTAHPHPWACPEEPLHASATHQSAKPCGRASFR